MKKLALFVLLLLLPALGCSKGKKDKDTNVTGEPPGKSEQVQPPPISPPPLPPK